ncbi:uncharacterized protein [Macrobrachium rosenbergii]|uniref:uncharacterized protein n=1 Tax=Macrobrachium rosenbergii TaxID=79674 RepID=UPI0034D47ECE
MDEASTTSCTEALLSSWISHFGAPDSITTDRGPAFLSELWVSLARLMGTTLHSTTAYNSAANSMIERAHLSLKAALMARCTNKKWKEQLLLVLLGLHTAPKADGDTSPAEKVYGETLAVPRKFFLLSVNGAGTHLPRLRELAQRFAPCHKTCTDRTVTYSPPALHSCTNVFITVDARRPPLTRSYRGPHRVIRRASKAFLLDIHGQEDWITIDRLKPAFLLYSEICEEAGRRPRVPPQFLPEGAPASPPSGAQDGPKNTSSHPQVSAPPRAHISPEAGARSNCLSASMINVDLSNNCSSNYCLAGGEYL